MFPGADPGLVTHAVQLVAAFDVATVFAMSFGVAKFQLAQTSEISRRAGGKTWALA